jgi:hypothetical protein
MEAFMATAAPIQKNKRLTQGDRDTLFTLATKQVVATENSDALDAAYDAAAQVVHDALVAKYPQKDMLVLKRYDTAKADQCVYVTRAMYDYDRFNFRDGDTRIPLRPVDNCNRNAPFSLEGEQAKVYEAFKDAEKAHKKTLDQRMADYKALIYGARNFNEVVSVWPAAEVLRESIVGTGTALRVLSEDVVARIQRDAAHALAEAA